MSSPRTRRAALRAGAAMVGALYVPGLALASAPAVDLDAELFALLDRYPATLEAMRAAGDRFEALWDAFVEAEPEHPTALHHRPNDGFRIEHAVYKLRDGRKVDVYEHGDVEQLRAMPQPTRCEETYTPHPEIPGDQIVHLRRVPDERRIARRTEILTAHDAWWADCQAIKDRLGIPAAEQADERAHDALLHLEAAILAMAPMTHAGLAAKARWVVRSHRAASVLDWHRRIVENVVAMAERGGATL